MLAGEGKTIFISSHILSELGEMCDTLLFINQPGNPLGVLYGGMAILVINTLAHLYTVPHLTAITALKQVDREFEAVGASLKVPMLAVFRRVTLPLAWPAVISSLLMCFIISFDEFVMAFFLSGTDPTLPVFLFGQLRFPNKLPGVLALGSLILLVSTILVVAAELLRRRGVQERPA